MRPTVYGSGPRRFFGGSLLLGLILAAGGKNLFADDAGIEFFEKKIRPVLVEHCYQCHSALAKEVKGGLLLDSRASLLRGGESGPVILPGDATGSPLLSALRHESLEMPPGRQLPARVADDFARWIDGGAPDPRDEPADSADRLQLARADQFALWRQWWSLQPVVESPEPPVQDMTWSAQPVDRFILAELEKNGLRPAPPADRATLMRRLSFALTGLPPTLEQTQAFLADESPEAWPRLVDGLLASPHFGERWARHWMDVVRYSDTYGYEWDIPAKGAWRYRDYLIRAFNDDVPFDQLVREHIAGDLLEQPRIDPVDQINLSRIGPMFFQMGEKRHGDSSEFDGIHQEMLDNKIDAFSKTFQAQTIACARCHDHKLDPVLQLEYYALGGVFMSSRWVTNTLDTPQRNAELIAELTDIKTALRGELGPWWLQQLDSLGADLLATLEPAAADAPRRRIWAELWADGAPEPPLEDARHAWYQLVRTSRDGGDPAARWLELRDQYAEQQRQRAAQNAADFQLATDFREPLPAGWSRDGVGLRQTTACGDFLVDLDGPACVQQLLPGGLFTHALSPRLNGALRTPFLRDFDKNYLTFEYCGGDFSAHRTVIDNAFLTEKQTYLNQPTLNWLKLSTQRAMSERRIYIELATKTSNPNFPPRHGLGADLSQEQMADPRSWFGVTRAWLHDKDAAPADELSRFQSLLASDSPRDLKDVAERYQRWFQAAVAAWTRGEAREDDVRVINWLLTQQQLEQPHAVQQRPQIVTLVRRYRELEQKLLVPQTINGMADIDAGYDVPLNERGEYDQPRALVPRGFVSAFAPDHATAVTAGCACAGSGRRELAELIADPQKNPLTARVFVNRVWHWLFGAGLVTTPNDFGHAGARPSHPELLDYLAARFVADGWSLKKLVRTIVLTETWRQSSHVDPSALTRDPENRLLHHYALRRLEAEPIRDAMLAASGKLDPRLYGPPVDPYRSNEDPAKRLFSGPLDGQGRRSIYIKMTIMEPPRLLALFNQPAPKIPTGRRDSSNTPAQALALLNDPLVIDLARHWARQTIQRPHATIEVRMQSMFRGAIGREPTDEETTRWVATIEELAALRGVSANETLSSTEVWTDVAHVLFNTKEFLYDR
jgi:hypothetical protein